MANPTKYTPGYSFSGFQASNPTKPLPAPRLDDELANISEAVTGTQTALGDIRRSDGKLVNEIVTLESLSPDVRGRLGGGGSGGGGGGPIAIDDVTGLPARLEAIDRNVTFFDDELDRLSTGAEMIMRKGAAGGYAPLDNGSRVPVANLPMGSTTATGAVRLGTAAQNSASLALTTAEGYVLRQGKADKGTTLAAYGIGDAYTKEQANAAIQAAVDAGGSGGSGSETPQTILSKLLTVDGAGSGLSADTLQGLVPSDLARAAQLPPLVLAPAYYGKADAVTRSKLFAREEAGTLDVGASSLVSVASPFNDNYEGGNFAASHVRHVAEGTNKNGPRGAALGLGISIAKEGFGTGTAKGGEIDGLYIVLRQDSPRNNAQGPSGGAGDVVADRGDGCGLLIDAAVYEKVGFVGGIEGATQVLANDGSGANKVINYQLAVVDTTRDHAAGLQLNMVKGKGAVGLRILSAEPTGYFENYVICGTEANPLFSVDRNGFVGLGRRLNDGSLISTSVYMAVQSDASLGWFNAPKNVQLLNLDQAGNVNAFGNVAAAAVVSRSTVTASGNIVSGGGFRGPDIILTAGARDSTNLSTFKRGQLIVGNGGRLRYCETDGVSPRYVTMQNS